MRRRHTLYLSLGLLGWGITACHNSPSPESSPLVQPAGAKDITIKGAGASFPARLYQKWAMEFNKIYPHILCQYQPVGSRAGITQFMAGLVDFGASDVPMLDREVAKVGRGALMLPMTAGAVVFAYNLGSITNLYLSRASYINIWLGKITRWNDPAILKDNPNLNLPDLEITLFYRSDDSGTTEILTRHLSAISKEWRNSLGTGRKVAWRRGTGVRGNEGISAEIQRRVGSIGFVEYSYALQNKLSIAKLQNRAGAMVTADMDSQIHALARISLKDNLVGIEPDPLGDDSYPIVAYTWLLVYRQYPTPAQGAGMKTFLQWALSTGQTFSSDLGYIPVPNNVIGQVSASIEQIQE